MSKPTMKLGNITVPAGLEGKDLLKFLVENKALLIAEKKATIKRADAITVDCDMRTKFFVDKDGKLNKGVAPADQQPEAGGVETVICVINTTNWLDSHGDVHIPGLWNKSLKDSGGQLHLQEHEMGFAYVISDESKGYTEKLTWKELGLNIAGVTEALIFASPLKGRNPYMEDQYRKKYVKNHSVGMRYVTIKLCVNDSEDDYYKEEYANWVQYAPMVANIADAEAQGYFWAVLEAKVIEGSAVVKGSNIMTPTIGFKSAEPAKATQTNQPASATGSTTEEIAETKDTSVNWDKIGDHLFN
jgi:hypothetical protein